MVRYVGQLILVAGALLGAQSILAAGIDGQVVDGDDAPIAGAMITLFRADSLYSETVYSDNKGSFHLDTALEGDLTLRARAPRFVDAQQTIHLLAAGTAKADVQDAAPNVAGRAVLRTDGERAVQAPEVQERDSRRRTSRTIA